MAPTMPGNLDEGVLRSSGSGQEMGKRESHLHAHFVISQVPGLCQVKPTKDLPDKTEQDSVLSS